MNKKYLFIILIFLIAPQIASSQAAIIAVIFGDKVASEKFNLSMEIGVPFNNFSNIDNSSIKRGVNFGIAGNVKLSDHWYVSPTVYFLSKRKLELDQFSLNTTDVNLNALFANTSTEIIINYTDVHLLLAFQPGKSNFRFGISPQVSFVGKANAIYAGEIGEFKQDIKDLTNSIDYGIIGNLAYFFKAGHQGKGIHINLRYYQGLTDVFKENFISGKNQSNYFSIHLSLPFITDELAAENLEE